MYIEFEEDGVCCEGAVGSKTFLWKKGFRTCRSNRSMFDFTYPYAVAVDLLLNEKKIYCSPVLLGFLYLLVLGLL